MPSSNVPTSVCGWTCTNTSPKIQGRSGARCDLVYNTGEYPTRRSAEIDCSMPQECRGFPTNMPRAGVRGVLRAYFLAAEFVKVCRLLAGDETPRARLYYKQAGEVLLKAC